MKSLWMIRAGLLGFSLLLYLIPAARAQEATNVRVVRLSRVEGDVLVSHSGSNQPEQALVNLPLQQGDSLATQDGLAEIEFENGAMAYLAENSTLQFTGLELLNGGRATRLTITQGAGTFYANLTSSDRFSVLTPTFEVAIPERAEFRVDTFSDGASVEVLEGSISVRTQAGSTTLDKGQSVAIHSKDFDQSAIGRIPNPDNFDLWVSEQSETVQSGTSSALSYLNSPNYSGLSDLSIYGVWMNYPGYGFTWRPFPTGSYWRPFLHGIWQLDPNLGWIWVSNEPWGWMPYHFGSWLLTPTVGWVWVPGNAAGLRHWEGARVNWVHAGDQVGWVPMSPNDRDGVPANLAQGIITRSGASPQNADQSNQIIESKRLNSKGLNNVTVIRQPPADFASHPNTGAAIAGFKSGIRRASQNPDSLKGIVYDKQTNTFINSNELNQAGEPRTRLLPAPRSGARLAYPPSSNPASRTGSTLAPASPYPARITPSLASPAVHGSYGNRPAGQMPARLPVNIPNPQPHAFSSPPRPVNPSQARPASPAAAPPHASVPQRYGSARAEPLQHH